jgi:hypothetical protein
MKESSNHISLGDSLIEGRMRNIALTFLMEIENTYGKVHKNLSVQLDEFSESVYSAPTSRNKA